ncbi:MAG: hypothetical protein KF768_13175 [Phycisphaeraceae bacterium]|nr:hypothetical protein [Phycisphaeraceae bacterium]
MKHEHRPSKQTSGAEDAQRKRKVILIGVAAAILAVSGLVLYLQRPEVADATDHAAVEVGEQVIERLRDQPPQAPPPPENPDEGPANIARPVGGGS